MIKTLHRLIRDHQESQFFSHTENLVEYAYTTFIEGAPEFYIGCPYCEWDKLIIPYVESYDEHDFSWIGFLRGHLLRRHRSLIGRRLPKTSTLPMPLWLDPQLEFPFC
jgi:hypothetical protein